MARKVNNRLTAKPPMSLATKLKIGAIVLILLVLDVVASYYYIVLIPQERQAKRDALAVSDVMVEGVTGEIVPPVIPMNQVVPPQPLPAVRYVEGNFVNRVPSNNPRFGTGFNYSKALSGNLDFIPLTERVRSGILVDLDTHKVLWEKDAYRSVPIASMTKMMTILLFLEEMERQPSLTFDSWLPVSKAAALVGESSVYLVENEAFTVDDFFEAVIIKSANDAAYVLGEHLGGGDINRHLANMNKRAVELHMPGASYSTPNGLPDGERVECYGSAEGMALLAERLLEYPIYLDYSSRKGGKIRQMVYSSTNRLLSNVEGVDGLKTGYTNAARSCITVSCLRNGRRLVLVLTGLPSSADRNACAEQLLNWGYKR